MLPFFSTRGLLVWLRPQARGGLGFGLSVSCGVGVTTTSVQTVAAWIRSARRELPGGPRNCCIFVVRGFRSKDWKQHVGVLNSRKWPPAKRTHLRVFFFFSLVDVFWRGKGEREVRACCTI